MYFGYLHSVPVKLYYLSPCCQATINFWLSLLSTREKIALQAEEELHSQQQRESICSSLHMALSFSNKPGSTCVVPDFGCFCWRFLFVCLFLNNNN